MLELLETDLFFVFLNFNRCQKRFESIRLFLSQYGFCSLDSMHHLINDKLSVKNKIKNKEI